VSIGWKAAAAAAGVVVASAAVATVVGSADVAMAGGRAGFAVRLASVDPNGVDGNLGSGYVITSLSADGRFVAFLSDADNLVPGDLNAARDAFVKDRRTGSVERVSVGTAGGEANGTTEHVSMSADGRYVAFASGASNLVTGDLNGVSDIFVRDRVGATTTRVSTSATGVEANGSSGSPAISANGLFVVFDSAASNLAPGDLGGHRDVFVRAPNGWVERVSLSTAGTAGNDGSFDAGISADGRVVAFTSGASNLVAGDLNGRTDIFLRDRAIRTTERVSVSTAGVEGDDHAGDPVVSFSGQQVAFTSRATNLVPTDTNLEPDVFVRDRASATTTRASVADNGDEGNGASLAPAISGDGRFVAFESDATNLTPRSSSRTQIYGRDLARGQTDLVSARRDGTPSDHWAYRPAINADGSTIAFRSDAVNLTPVGFRPQLYVRGTGLGPDPNCALGESSIVCELLYGDGVGPVAIRWYVNRVHVPSLDGEDVASHPCTPGLDVEVEVVVTDANGPIGAHQILPCLTDRP